MSFFSIKDPFERARVVEDYKKNLREIRKRDQDQRLSGVIRQRTLQETYHPIVRSQEEMTRQIVQSLKDIKGERRCSSADDDDEEKEEI